MQYISSGAASVTGWNSVTVGPLERRVEQVDRRRRPRRGGRRRASGARARRRAARPSATITAWATSSASGSCPGPGERREEHQDRVDVRAQAHELLRRRRRSSRAGARGPCSRRPGPCSRGRSARSRRPAGGRPTGRRRRRRRPPSSPSTIELRASAPDATSTGRGRLRYDERADEDELDERSASAARPPRARPPPAGQVLRQRQGEDALAHAEARREDEGDHRHRERRAGRPGRRRPGRRPRRPPPSSTSSQMPRPSSGRGERCTSRPAAISTRVAQQARQRLALDLAQHPRRSTGPKMRGVQQDQPEGQQREQPQPAVARRRCRGRRRRRAAGRAHGDRQDLLVDHGRDGRRAAGTPALVAEHHAPDAPSARCRARSARAASAPRWTSIASGGGPARGGGAR